MNWRKLYEEQYRLILFVFIAAVIAIVYFGLNKFNILRGAKIGSLAIPLESSIPQISIFIWLYILVYLVYVSPIFFVNRLDKFERMARAYLFVVFVSALFYIFLPFKMSWPSVSATTISDCMLLVLRSSVEQPYNLLPSMHVSLAFLASFIVKAENKKWGIFLIIASTAIALSTLFVKQHYIVDLVSGFVLAYIAYRLFFK